MAHRPRLATLYPMPPPHTTTTAAINGEARRAQVLLPLPLPGAYDYRVPQGLEIEPGAFVFVPFGRRDAIGVVWSMEASGEVPDSRLKDIEERLDVAPLPDSTRRFVEWVARYTLSPPGAVLRMAMSVSDALFPEKPRVAYRIAETPPEDLRLTGARKRVLAVAADGFPRSAIDLAREAAVGTGVVSGLAKAGALDQVAMPERAPPKPDPSCPALALTGEQQAAADSLVAAVAVRDYNVTVVDGVTGAGKTEVYFEAIAETLRQGRQVLVLLPEIALTAHWLERFEERFGAMPQQWHSELTQTQRRRTWRAVADGTAHVVVGARSALFLPYRDLGLIIVDEEHDSSFKQQDGIAYHARDMAVVRASLEKIPILLVSATPSLETVVNVEEGRYQLVHLPSRHGAAGLPDITVIDMRKDAPPRQCWLSPPLRAAIEQTLADGEQALLFLNRRGYAPLTLCRSCGHRLECPNCTAWLVEHRLARRLECHHCGYLAPYPETCPECGAEDSLVACGPGVERLAEEVHALFPAARMASLTSDSVHGPAAIEELIARMRKHEIDILIGTQIVAKGHHFPNLTLVGVIDADLGLTGGDLRAAERTYQLLHQVAGRAGRDSKPGRVLLQTYNPDHPVMTALAAGARDRFVAEEADQRHAGGWPPFGRLAALVLSGPDEAALDAYVRQLAQVAPRYDQVRVLGPAPAPLARLRKRHRRRFLVKTPRGVSVQRVLSEWLERVRAPSSIRVQVDIDPYSFL
jgi:primosomal protein N' (replication factor Y) (superfamily II helicase)